MLNSAFLYSFQSNKETENQMFKIGLGRIGCLLNSYKKYAYRSRFRRNHRRTPLPRDRERNSLCHRDPEETRRRAPPHRPVERA